MRMVWGVLVQAFPLDKWGKGGVCLISRNECRLESSSGGFFCDRPKQAGMGRFSSTHCLLNVHG